MTGDGARPEEKMFTVAQAADYMLVSDNTVRNWLKERRLEFEFDSQGLTIIALSKLRAAKVLQAANVLDRLKADGVTDEDIVRAVAEEAAHPSPDSRYSVEDADAVAKFKKGTWKRPEPTTTAVEPEEPGVVSAVAMKNPVPVEPDEYLVRTGRWEELVKYIVSPYRDPMRIRANYWDTRDCPEFVPSAGIFRFTYGALCIDMLDQETTNYIRRSEGWFVSNGRPVPAPEEKELEVSDEGPVWPPGGEVPKYKIYNDRWRHQRMAWEEAWYQRHRQLRAQGKNVLTLPSSAPAEQRNEVKLRAKYHDEGWGAADLPDWFWDTDECPVFEPPNEVCRYVYGEQAEDPDTGEVVTYIRSSACHAWSMDFCVDNPGNERFDKTPGRYAAGSTPAKYEHQNRQWDAAERAWLEEWKRRARRRRGE
jgi:excisionase family DNA binding protein